MKTSYFEYKKEEGQNPYIGFMSFQHFRGEKLYSDIVVKPEKRMTETERVECYPVAEDAEENGRNEGWYPDCSIAYIRILWKDFEPQKGVYNFDFVESILNEAKNHKQTLVLRLMPHSTRIQDDVPKWLKELIPCPQRPHMERIKDSPTDPLFMELFLKAVAELGKRFDQNIWLDAVDIALPGAWGEGYKLENYPKDLFKTIVDTYASVFKHTQLLTQISRPDLVKYAKKYTNLGWRGDGLGEPNHTKEYYPAHIAKMSDQWEIAPVSFESYWWLTEWKRKNWEIDPIIEKTLLWHISSFNPKSIPIPYEWKKKCEFWISKMGYHYTINSISFPEEISSQDKTELTLTISNVGSAPCYKPLPLVLRLKSDDKCYDFTQSCDIRKWLPGTYTENLSIKLNSDIPSSRYSLEIGILSPHTGIVYFATSAPRDENFYILGSITVK